MATIYEVSKLAGVSLATVSRVMNNSGKVKPQTREKVEAAMTALGYRPNNIARSLASARSNSVGVLVPELHGPFFGTMLSNIESTLRSRGKHVIITAGHSDEKIEKESIEFLLSRRCDALILHTFDVSDEYLVDLSHGATPIVVIGRDITELNGSCISLDNEYGEYLATRALIELGHTRLAYIAGPLWKRDAKQRIAGYKRALSEYGMEFDERLVAEGSYEEPSGREAMKRLLRQGISFTGLVCANDEMATGAIVVARERGMTIPDDLSVVGFDNVFYTRYMHPTLSTVNYPIDRMGHMAARCVLRDVYEVADQQIQNRFEPEFVRRASTTSVGR